MEVFRNIGHFIETYGFTIIVVLLVIFGIYARIKKLIDSNIVEWLVDKVGDAESYFGSETGQLKLRSVYNTFVAQRPILALIISFDTFKDLVDVALDKFEDMIENNEKIKNWYEIQKQLIEEKKKNEELQEYDNNENNFDESITDFVSVNIDDFSESETVDINDNFVQIQNDEEYSDELVPDINISNGVDKKTVEKFTSKRLEKVNEDIVETTYYEKKEKEITENNENSSELYETTIEEVKKI